MTNGGQLSSGAITAAELVAAEMSVEVSFNNGISTVNYTPVVVGKKKPDEVPVSDGYEYWPTLAQQMEHVALGPVWSPKTTIRTQGSRQYLRGV